MAALPLPQTGRHISSTFSCGRSGGSSGGWNVRGRMSLQQTLELMRIKKLNSRLAVAYRIGHVMHTHRILLQLIHAILQLGHEHREIRERKRRRTLTIAVIVHEGQVEEHAEKLFDFEHFELIAH